MIKLVRIMFQNYSGYRMAAECAKNALLEKVADNKLDSGDEYFLYSLFL